MQKKLSKCELCEYLLNNKNPSVQINLAEGFLFEKYLYGFGGRDIYIRLYGFGGRFIIYILFMSIISKIKNELSPMYFIAKGSFYVSLGESIAHNIIENFENKEKITNSIIYITNQLDDIMRNTASHLPLGILCILSLHSKNISLKNLGYILASISAHFVYESGSDHNFGEILAIATIGEIFAYIYE